MTLLKQGCTFYGIHFRRCWNSFFCGTLFQQPLNCIPAFQHPWLNKGVRGGLLSQAAVWEGYFNKGTSAELFVYVFLRASSWWASCGPQSLCASCGLLWASSLWASCGPQSLRASSLWPSCGLQSLCASCGLHPCGPHPCGPNSCGPQSLCTSCGPPPWASLRWA